MKIYHVNKNESLIRNGLLFFLLAGLSYLTLTSDLSPVVILLIEISFVLVLGFSIIYSVIKRIIIEEDRMILKNLFGDTVLGVNEIRGYRLITEGILIECSVIESDFIIIENIYDNNQEIYKWLASKSQNLNKINAPDRVQYVKEKAYESIFNNPKYGNSVEERKIKFKKAKQMANALYCFSTLIIIWQIIYPKPLELCFICCLAIPIISVLLAILSKGLIRFSNKENRIFPTIEGPIIVSMIVIMARLFVTYVIIDFAIFFFIFKFFISISAFIALYLLWKSKFKSKFILFFVISMFYFSFAVIGINCVFDYSDPKLFKYEIKSKYIISGKSKFYELEILPKVDQPLIYKVSVGKLFYERSKVGDIVEIKLKDGLFGIPWYKSKID